MKNGISYINLNVVSMESSRIKSIRLKKTLSLPTGVHDLVEDK